MVASSTPGPSCRGRAGGARRPRARDVGTPGNAFAPGSSVRLGSAVGAERSARSGWRGRPISAAAEHLELARDALRLDRAVGRRDLAALRAGVEQHAEDLVARHAVDDRVVDLGQQRHAPVLQAVDQVELPQRAACGRAGARRCARRSRRAGGRRRAAARRSRGRGSRGRSPGPRSSTGGRDRAGRRRAASGTAAAGGCRSPTSRQMSLKLELAARRRRRVVDGEAAHVPVGPRRTPPPGTGRPGSSAAASGLLLAHTCIMPCPPRRGREPAKWDDRAVSTTGLTAATKRRILVACILGTTVVTVDWTAINVALPAIAEDLGGGLAGQQWTANAYLLTLSSLLLIGGSLGDVSAGGACSSPASAGFGVTSLLCAMAPTIELLVAARGAAGRLRRAAHAGRAGGDRAHVLGAPSAARRSAPGPPGAASGPCSGRSSAASSWTRRRGAGSS